MEIVTVSNLHQAAKTALKKIQENYGKKNSLSIAIPGGRFGEAFTNQLLQEDIDVKYWNIFLTDERISKNKKNSVKRLIYSKVKSLKGFEENRFFSFGGSSLKQENYINIAKTLDSINIPFFDICLLSLGEDGHLAGHFDSSILFPDQRFCYSCKASKHPPRRISFNIKFLTKSKLVILVSVGSEKTLALEKLLDGKGIHSEILNGKLNVILDYLILIL